MTVASEGAGGGEPSPAEEQLYAPRRKFYPMAITGVFRTLKWRIMVVTLAIYYITPWLRWDRGPHAPDQAVLIDLAGRRFYFFFIEIWPQEFYYIAGLLIMAGVGLFLITSTVGRAWCGYACPQTVWTDVFLHVERWIDGDRNAQVRLENQKWDFDKIRKRVAKHGAWLLIGAATGGAWIFYFADAPTLLVNLFTGEAPLVAYSTVAILTATTYIFGGLLREQVCIYMCPWPRIQVAMLDADSLVVTYRDYRGEPRSHRRKHADPGTLGDCIDCNKCVAVCPMGIDIRDGQQLACITCALCIDACDEVMDRTGRPRGLIDYDTLRNDASAREGKPANVELSTFVRPRTIFYTVLWTLAGLMIAFSLFTRDRLDLNVLRDRNPVFVKLSDGSIRNGYTIKVLNMELRPRKFRLSVSGIDGALMTVAGVEAPPAPILDIDAKADVLKETKIFVVTPPGALDGESTVLTFSVRDLGGDEEASYTGVFRGPEP
ncbi:Type cbb3 cytochrome oxidase biogenesis protein CcoG, involved in Cu oxidation [hydrothermal vent metagenome]|uniref:Type cbb3 cytochrome oxidase biogenesis protein CcoG, involved in Cu oxidation n=1 Tax=hydrothermal vent metagenome TaxID=652676 RepID=A0A3B0TUS3_9ZZZZ